MAAAKKKTRKELLKEPDEFLTFTTRALAWAARYKKQINMAVLAVLAAGLLISGYIFYVNRQETQASALLSQALEKLERFGPGKPASQRVQEVSEDFRRIITDYGSRSNGSVARLLFANLCYEAGDYQQSADLYKASVPQFADQPMIRFQILKSLGYTYAALKDPATAAGYFEQALAGGATSLQDDVLFNLGDLYTQLGQPDKSAGFYKRILSEHSDSVFADLIRYRVAGLN